MKFGYEDLAVWNKAIEFGVDVINIVENISTDRKHYRLLEQIESSAASVSMNIAEGKGRFSKKKNLFNTSIFREDRFIKL
jgi:four helix bundle protein